MGEGSSTVTKIPTDLFPKISDVITQNSSEVMTGIGLIVSALAIFWFIRIAIRIIKATGSAIAR